MKKIELEAFLGFYSRPDKWPQADGRDDELKEVQWEEQAKNKLDEFERRLSELTGSDLGYLETEAQKCLNQPPSEYFTYLDPHRRMYLTPLLRLVRTEIDRRTAVLNPPESKENANERAEESKPQHQWHQSRRDTVNRRHIVLNNSSSSSKDLCGYFDTERVGLPEGWEKKFNVTTWKEAYKDQKARSNIHRIISTDRRK